MRRYVERNWAVLRTDLLDGFQLADIRSRDFIYTRHYLEDLCAQFGGRDDTEPLKSFLRTYDYISGGVTERGMMVEYGRTEMLLRALPKRLWRKAISKLGLNPLEPRTSEYGELMRWIAARIPAAEALTMFAFLVPAAPPLTTFLALAISPASTASPTSIASPAPLAPTSSTLSTAPTSTSAYPDSSTPATPKTHTTSPALLVSPAALASPAPFAPTAAKTTTTIPMAAKVPSTTVIITTLPSAPSPAAREDTIRAGLTVRLGIFRVEPP